VGRRGGAGGVVLSTAQNLRFPSPETTLPDRAERNTFWNSLRDRLRSGLSPFSFSLVLLLGEDVKRRDVLGSSEHYRKERGIRRGLAGKESWN
jgi:hypothetical protein